VTSQNALRRIVAALDEANISYMLTGSFASSYHGAPRASQDIDLVILATPDQLQTLVGLLPESEYYVDLESALDALRRQTQFNIIDLATGWKIDLITRKSRPFSLEEFNRRVRLDFQGLQLFITSAEDLILSKLEWAKIGQSHRQLEDVAGILKIRTGDLDYAYIEHWTKELDLDRELEAARRIAGND
jgi:hypothetical protein